MDSRYGLYGLLVREGLTDLNEIIDKVLQTVKVRHGGTHPCRLLAAVGGAEAAKYRVIYALGGLEAFLRGGIEEYKGTETRHPQSRESLGEG